MGNYLPKYAAPSIGEYFSGHPITELEQRRGRALRLVCLLRSAEGKFDEGPKSYLWIVLSCVRGNGVQPTRPKCVALFCKNLVPYKVGGIPPVLLATHAAAICDEQIWTLAEYSFCVSVGVPCLFLSAATSRLAVGRKKKNALIRDYGQKIANASVAPNYPEWLAARAKKRRATYAVPSFGPRMSIVTPAYKTPPTLLRKMLESVLAQTYQNWELVIINASPDDEGMRAVLSEHVDPRIKVIEQAENLGIVGNTNRGIGACTGDFVSFFDHDDVVEPDALAEYVRVINGRGGDVDLLYCDEDNIDEGDHPFLPLFKPDYNPDLLLSNNYIIHWLTVRRELLGKVELSTREVEGAQDYDLSFKIAELGGSIVHVPHVLYHWRIHSGSTAGDPAQKSYAQNAGVRAIEGHLNRRGINAEVRRGPAYFTYVVQFAVPNPSPDLVVACEGECSEKTKLSLESYALERGASVRCAGSLDRALADAGRTDPALVLCITPQHDLDFESLCALVANASRPDVFAVSPRVIRKDGLLDYAGMLVLPNGELGRLLRYLPAEDGGYVGRAQRPYDSMVVNPECCVFDAAQLGCLSAGESHEAFECHLPNLCLRAWKGGFRNLYLPYATSMLNRPRSVMQPGQGDPAEETCDLSIIGASQTVDFSDPSHNSCFDSWGAYYQLSAMS